MHKREWDVQDEVGRGLRRDLYRGEYGEWEGAVESSQQTTTGRCSPFDSSSSLPAQQQTRVIEQFRLSRRITSCQISSSLRGWDSMNFIIMLVSRSTRLIWQVHIAELGDSIDRAIHRRKSCLSLLVPQFHVSRPSCSRFMRAYKTGLTDTVADLSLIQFLRMFPIYPNSAPESSMSRHRLTQRASLRRENAQVSMRMYQRVSLTRNNFLTSGTMQLSTLFNRGVPNDSVLLHATIHGRQCRSSWSPVLFMGSRNMRKPIFSHSAEASRCLQEKQRDHKNTCR